MENRPELLHLLSLLCDEQLTERETDRLNELLQDPSARQVYLQYMDVHCRLLAPSVSEEKLWTGSLAHSPSSPQQTLPIRFSSTAMGASVVGVSSALILAAIALLWVWQSAGRNVPLADDQDAATTDNYIATITQTQNAEWVSGQAALREGARVVPGKLELLSGIVRLNFDSGSSLIVEGPAEIELQSSSSARLWHGKAVFQGDGSSSPFTLSTPSASFTDLDAEYGLSVDATAEKVQVFQGEVERRVSPGAEPADRLASGESRRFDQVNANTSHRLSGSSMFVRSLRHAVPKGARERLLACESFHYDHADALRDGTADGGYGFVDAWTGGFARSPESDRDDQMALNVNRDLNHPHIHQEGTTNSTGCFEHLGFAKYYRKLAAPIRLDIDELYYISCLFNRSGPPTDKLNAVSLQLREHDELEQEFRGGKIDLKKRLNFGVDRTSDLFTHLQRKGNRVPLPLIDGETYLLVAKIVASRQHPDQVFVRVYGSHEAVELSEPTSWSVKGPPVRSDLIFDWLEIHINSHAQQAVDEIRVATSWPAVLSNCETQ